MSDRNSFPGEQIIFFCIFQKTNSDSFFSPKMVAWEASNEVFIFNTTGHRAASYPILLCESWQVGGLQILEGMVSFVR